eukprot:TRINITY_DN6910_c0_g1_i1.p1 TRINITY_DN6910_c0_g1~~TRINITY_DN6910_c0_g1_i1.p1  ORF type:complete len:140 (-),score=28.43 TRINITY_DN6910_c0_g1_i1:77-496(-)
MPALPISVVVRLRLSRIMGRRGAAAKVETKQEKKEIQVRWKARIWGAAIENKRNSVALFSESTGRAKRDFSSAYPPTESLDSSMASLSRSLWIGFEKGEYSYELKRGGIISGYLRKKSESKDAEKEALDFKLKRPSFYF